ncbi:MAG: hypothetical protein JXX29_23665 [Deltaproteobacteria bacterium]|nr:hypothetical protein [Deltaproteobacteria bacterium]MBN2674699.1 hypothetical protein [Deltaproteobacteria bacterium]
MPILTSAAQGTPNPTKPPEEEDTDNTVDDLTSYSDGWASRYWDCCKPHCGWTGNTGNAGGTLQSCDQSDQYLWDYSAQIACAGGNAYVCFNLTPWSVSDSLSYGFVATAAELGQATCGKCYQFDFVGASSHAGGDAGSTALTGKHMIVQAINIGYDVNGNQFDLMVPGGGVGAFNACSSQWSSSDLGQQYGGWLSTCKSQGGSLDQIKSCVLNYCTQTFNESFEAELLDACQWFVDWYEAADNPAIHWAEVPCPSALVNLTGMQQ